MSFFKLGNNFDDYERNACFTYCFIVYVIVYFRFGVIGYLDFISI